MLWTIMDCIFDVNAKIERVPKFWAKWRINKPLLSFHFYNQFSQNGIKRSPKWFDYADFIINNLLHPICLAQLQEAKFQQSFPFVTK